MKSIRNLMAVVGLFVAVFALGTVGAMAQTSNSMQFTGTFTLPYAAQWGTMTLPAGEYTLKYGTRPAGPSLVEIAGTAKDSPHGIILVESADNTSATKNSIVCVRDGKSLLVRKLELPAIGEVVSFTMPQSVTLMAQRQQDSVYTLAQGPKLIQRVPVTLSSN